MTYSIEQYKKDALQSMKPHENKDLAIMDWFLGMCGESKELYEEMNIHFLQGMANGANVIKELGDCIWYFMAMKDELALESPIFIDSGIVVGNPMDIQYAAEGIKELCLEIAEELKHHVFHKEDRMKKIVELLLAYWGNLQFLAAGLKLNFLSVMELNGAKLQHRYGGDYSDSKSAERHAEEVKFTDTLQYVRIMKEVFINDKNPN